MALIIKRDEDIPFPHFTVLKASAGSGKTHALTQRFVQFILSDRIQKNRLKNILAITFSNNASKEMKERILQWLKALYFNDAKKVKGLCEILANENENLIEKAGLLIEEILNNYADFQVKTIDSFMTSVFKASAIDFGYNPEFEILLNNDSLMEYAFDLFLRNVREGTKEARLLGEVIDIIGEHKKTEASYPWDPSRILLDEIKNIYRKLSSSGKKPLIEDRSAETKEIKEKIKESVDDLEHRIEQSGLERSKASSYEDIRRIVQEGRFADLIGKGLAKPPVNKPKPKYFLEHQPLYETILSKWSDLGSLVNQYISLYAYSHYLPYLRAYAAFSDTIESIKREQGKVFIEDINRYLSEYLNSALVPDVYFRIGEVIFHFLIDEFQDTSPIQWKNLEPLIDNSLSQGGSLFVVGDTKQAIYGFRDADYSIMKGLELENPFKSARHDVKELEKNYRSLQRILNFNEDVFKKIASNSDTYKEAARRSGLNDYIQNVDENKKDPGYVEVTLWERNDEDPPEKKKIGEVINDLYARGYSYGDIALLAQKNEDVVRVTTWLSEFNIPFVSYSSLDIRRRKVTAEIIYLLDFLDSPLNDMSFTTFILGELFTRTLNRDYPECEVTSLREFPFLHRNNRPLYKSFQNSFPKFWERYFSGLFKSSGYLPLYDLLTEIFSVFRVFEILGDEEAALVRILEVVKNLEAKGYNNIKDFLNCALDKETVETEWNMSKPKNINAVEVMTIHKSKGLGFPAVIALLYEERNRGFDYFIHEENGSVCLLKINQQIAKSNPQLAMLYEEERTKERVNKLNTLYVGLTRAKEELYVIGVKGKNHGYPFDLFPADNYQPSDKPAGRAGTESQAKESFEIIHHHERVDFAVTPDRAVKVEEKERGEFIHRVLAHIEYVNEGFEEELIRIIKREKDEIGEGCGVDEIKDIITAMLNNEDIAGYFEWIPGRVVRNEQEFANGEGRLFRMDRVVIDRDRITILDYKTGADRDLEGKYTSQMVNYMNIISEIYPDRKVSGIIAYLDINEARRIV